MIFDRNEKKLEIAQGGQSKTYKVSIKVDNIEEEIQEENPLLLDLTDVDEARKAFIASEIFNRKYE